MNNCVEKNQKIYMYYPNEIERLKPGQHIWLKCPFCKNGKVRIRKGKTFKVVCTVEGEIAWNKI